VELSSLCSSTQMEPTQERCGRSQAPHESGRCCDPRRTTQDVTPRYGVFLPTNSCPTAASDRSSDRIDDLESDEVLFVVRHHNTFVRPGDCGDDHVEPASRLAGRFAFSHHVRPDQPRLVVERQYAARKERLGSLRPAEPLVECVALPAAGLLIVLADNATMPIASRRWKPAASAKRRMGDFGIMESCT